jgi:hypothetical protein
LFYFFTFGILFFFYLFNGVRALAAYTFQQQSCFCAPAVIILHGADDGIEKHHCWPPVNWPPVNWPPVKKGKNIKMGADNVLARSLPGTSRTLSVYSSLYNSSGPCHATIWILLYA